jgi:nucleoside-diphosphate-sugar epimerase
VDNFISGDKNNLTEFLDNHNFTFINADVINLPETYLPPDVQIDVIFHFASPASPPIYQRFPIETYQVNTVGTHNLLNFLKNNNLSGRFLMASTSEVYGDPQVHPQPENYWGNVNPNGVRSCYDEAKRLSETICGVFQRDFGVDARIVRIFNTYGSKNNLDDGRIIPQFIKQYLAGEKLTVYGDGSQTRSYCFVDDLVEGLLIYVATDNLAGETINLGNPHEYTILETAQLFNELVGRPLDFIEFLALPKNDPTKRRPDIGKAQMLLEWQPTTEFREGLRKTIDWYINKVK